MSAIRFVCDQARDLRVACNAGVLFFFFGGGGGGGEAEFSVWSSFWFCKISGAERSERSVEGAGKESATFLGLAQQLKEWWKRLMVQRSAARCCFNNYSRQPGVVTNMLEKLAWPSLKGRRKLSRLTTFHRVVNSYVEIERDLYLNPISHTSRDGNSMLFLRPHSSCNQHANSFFPWSIRHWNKLPGAIVNIKDNNIFKCAVYDHLVKQGEWF